MAAVAQAFRRLDANGDGKVSFRDALAGALARGENITLAVVAGAMEDAGISEETFPAANLECVDHARHSATRLVQVVQQLEKRGLIQAAVLRRRVPLTSARITSFMRSHGMQTVHKRTCGGREERRRRARVQRRQGERALPLGGREWQERRLRRSRDQAWAQQPAEGGNGSRTPAELIGKSFLGDWNGRPGHVSIEERDVRDSGGPPKLGSAEWKGFTFKRGSKWHTVDSVGDADTASSAICWAAGMMAQVTQKEVHRAWLQQQRGVSHCDCDECRPAAAPPAEQWRHVGRRQQTLQQAFASQRAAKQRDEQTAAHRSLLTEGRRVLAKSLGCTGWYKATVSRGDALTVVNLDYDDGDKGHRVPIASVKVRDHVGDNPNLDECYSCEDGGDLVLCDFCSVAAHSECIGPQVIPLGLWKCRLCAEDDEIVAAEWSESEAERARERARESERERTLTRREGRKRGRAQPDDGIPAAPPAKRGRRRKNTIRKVLRTFVGRWVYVPAPFNKGGHITSLSRGGQHFNIKWRGDTVTYQHEIHQVAKWMRDAGDTALEEAIGHAPAGLARWKWVYALRVKTAGRTWRVSGTRPTSDAMDQAQAGGCRRCARRVRRYSPAHGLHIRAGKEQGWITNYRPHDDTVEVEWSGWSRRAREMEGESKSEGGNTEALVAGAHISVNDSTVLADARVEGDKEGGWVLTCDHRRQWHPREWAFDVLQGMDAKFNDNVAEAVGECGAAGMPLGCESGCKREDFVQGSWSRLGLSKLVPRSMGQIMTDRASALMRDNTTEAAVQLAAAVMAAPSMGDECDACCLRAALMTGHTGKLVAYGGRGYDDRERRAHRLMRRKRRQKRRERRSAMMKRFKLVGYVPRTHKFILEDAQDGGRRREVADRVLEWMGLTIEAAERALCRQQMRARDSERERVCVCLGGAAERETASSRFWVRAGHGAEMLRAGAGEPAGVGDPGFYGDTGPEGDSE